MGRDRSWRQMILVPKDPCPFWNVKLKLLLVKTWLHLQRHGETLMVYSQSSGFTSEATRGERQDRGGFKVGHYPRARPLTHRRAWRGGGGGVYVNPQRRRTAHAIGMRPGPQGWAMSSLLIRWWLITKIFVRAILFYNFFYIEIWHIWFPISIRE